MQEEWKDILDEKGLKELSDPTEEPSKAEYDAVPAIVAPRQHYIPEIEIEL